MHYQTFGALEYFAELTKDRRLLTSWLLKPSIGFWHEAAVRSVSMACLVGNLRVFGGAEHRARAVGVMTLYRADGLRLSG